MTPPRRDSDAGVGAVRDLGVSGLGGVKGFRGLGFRGLRGLGV